MPGDLTYTPSQHSPFGPSSFERAEACPASTDEAALRSDRSRVYADEGTCAHVLLHACLLEGAEAFEFMDCSVISQDGEVLGEIDGPMIEHVDKVVTWVRQNMLPTLGLEKRLSLKATQMFGNADILGHAKADLMRVVLDLKYGMVWVPADAVQLGLYGLMDAKERGVHLPGLPADTPVVRAVLAQPRMKDPIRTFDWTAGALMALEARVHRLIELRESGRPLPFNAGPHCRYCGRVPFCPQLRAVAKDAALAKIVATPEQIAAGHYSADDIDAALEILPAVERWVKGVTEAMESYIMAGGRLKNAKAVRGRGSRDWKDAEKAAAFMKAKGVDPYEKALLSPAKAEKAVPKIFHPHLEALIDKLPGKIKAAHITAGGEPVAVAASLENAALANMAYGLIDKG